MWWEDGGWGGVPPRRGRRPAALPTADDSRRMGETRKRWFLRRARGSERSSRPPHCLVGSHEPHPVTFLLTVPGGASVSSPGFIDFAGPCGGIGPWPCPTTMTSIACDEEERLRANPFRVSYP